MDELLKALPSVRVPTAQSRVYKDECSYSYHNQESNGGVLVDMNSFLAFSPTFAKLNFERTGHAVYLNIKKHRIVKAPKEGESEAPTVMGIGVSGGFKIDGEVEYDTKYDYAIVTLPSFKSLAFPDANLPMLVSQSADAIIKHDSAEKQEEVKAWTADASLEVSPLALELFQENNGRKLPMSGWTCDICGGGANTNLWLNLSSGAVLCGRKNFDGTGGNGHALEHYKVHPNYPLAVKLGTITEEGKADVWSYAQDDMVIDPYLEKHLAHWNLDMKTLKKTDKTVAELELELQKTYDWSKATESSHRLVPQYGPGFTGLENLGNSCYVNSVIQVLMKIPEFEQRYFKNSDALFRARYDDPSKDFHVQFAKLARGVLSGEYSLPPPDPIPQAVPGQEAPQIPPCSIRPLMFKQLVGTQKAEFATNKQQDAQEFLQFLLDLIHKREHTKNDGVDPTEVFDGQFEERLECSITHQVKYKAEKTNHLLLPVPQDLSQNADEVEMYESIEMSKSEDQKKAERDSGTAPTPVRHRIRLEDSIGRYFEPETVDDWYSPAAKQNTTAVKSKKIAEFPKILTLSMLRFKPDFKNNKIIKLEDFVVAPDELDLEKFRGRWLQPGEVEMKGDSEKPLQLDEQVIQSIISMGFPRVRAERAAFNNQGKAADVALDWLFSHMDDADIDTPLPQLNAKKEAAFEVDEEGIAMLMSMGFSRVQCEKGLKNTANNVERAIEWLFSHQDDMDTDAKPAAAASDASAKPSFSHHSSRALALAIIPLYLDYKLFAFITHMGSSTQSGHYVSHIKVNGKWYIFNDSKVAESQEPPRELAYIYFYERV